MLVVQRTQPNAKALEGWFSRFEKLQRDMFVGGGANFALASEAEKKKSSVESLEIQKTVVVNKVKQEIEEIEKCVPLSTICSIDMAIRKSVRDCLEKNDFNFVSFKDDPKGLKNVAGEYIESIKEQLYKKATEDNTKKEEDKIFNSQSFNFGCSEQLLIDYIFLDKLTGRY